jgi:hypothetical protein
MDFPGCAARAALKASLEKAPTERWIIGSNDIGNRLTAERSQVVVLAIRISEFCRSQFSVAL